MSEEITEEKKNGLGAKFLSKLSMIFAGIWIGVLTILKGFNKIDLSIKEIIWSGIAIAAVWTPTYFSIFLDKVKEMKFND